MLSKTVYIKQIKRHQVMYFVKLLYTFLSFEGQYILNNPICHCKWDIHVPLVTKELRTVSNCKSLRPYMSHSYLSTQVKHRLGGSITTEEYYSITPPIQLFQSCHHPPLHQTFKQEYVVISRYQRQFLQIMEAA